MPFKVQIGPLMSPNMARALACLKQARWNTADQRWEVLKAVKLLEKERKIQAANYHNDVACKFGEKDEKGALKLEHGASGEGIFKTEAGREEEYGAAHEEFTDRWVEINARQIEAVDIAHLPQITIGMIEVLGEFILEPGEKPNSGIKLATEADMPPASKAPKAKSTKGLRKA